MISVQNRRQQLNGSSIVWLLVLLFLGSCSGSKRTAGPKRGPLSKTERPDKLDSVRTIEVDTIQWTNKIDETPGIEVGDGRDVDRPKVMPGTLYKIAMMLPLNPGQTSVSDGDSEKFIHYYAGAKMARRELEAKGVKMNITVLNEKKSDATIPSLPDDLDAIIGSYATASNKENLFKLIEYGKSKKTAVISPWYSTSNLIKENPYYIQLQPNLREHFLKIAQHIMENFDLSEVSIVLRNKELDDAWQSYFESALKAYASNTSSLKLHKIVVNESILNNPDTKNSIFGPAISQGKRVFIIPNYSLGDEEYIYAALNKLSTDREGRDVIVYGMPVMLESNRINFSYYSALNMRIVVSEFIDKTDPAVLRFMKMFFDEYGTLPLKEAFEGHDIMMFLGESLNEYGKYFHEISQQEPKRYLTTSFRLQQVYPEGNDNFNSADFVENKHLDVIQFRDNKFIRL